eukprot:CAMPEP_0178657644 /NCGR_PEP_ID=MMETSP0698-20121128/25513_1 /TAXON_ID=265572 /ORGANISM="Extubocellulus spinifer, Strain CCMP396" /LENGTH=704 /DNA_ID=CAMNT_0020299871 /DNA_START=17 /DNA_END=2131 /DNA_ORIENTATION=-
MAAPPSSPSSDNRDASSLSDPDVATFTHLSWRADVSFETHVITAVALYDVLCSDEASSQLWLDTRGLTIDTVEVDGNEVTNWTLEASIKNKDHLGRRLIVPLRSNAAANKSNKKCKVTIAYTTSPHPSECTAAQWLPPSQTAGKIHPYLFTQCQAIHARSLVPCQDLPGTKFTYDARVTVPSWATAVMSALPGEEHKLHRGKKSKGGTDSAPPATISRRGSTLPARKVYNFKQPVPIPSYLLALAVGDLEGYDISPRCRIYSEPSVVEAAAYEFSQTEDFLQAAEDLTGIEYPWTRYDLLVLPPSFPYGGMENPCLTFVTPTLLAGDRSLADVVAHEISHSWTGNLITNKTWSHFWLNEGWTVWCQRKIMSHPKVCPDKALASGVFGLDSLGGWKHLTDDVALHSEEDTKMVLPLGDGDPDEAYSSVPYEKGFNLLHCLEGLVGPEAFLDFAKQYMDKFKYGTVTSEEFRSFFKEHFKGKKEESKAFQFDWDSWLYKPGMPPAPYEPNFDRSLAEGAENLASEWLEYDAGKIVGAPGTGSDIEKWSTAQRTWFLDVMLAAVEKRSAPLKVETVTAMKDTYSFHEQKNAEVLFRFLLLAVPTADVGSDILDITTRFITTQGRMKYVRPLYRTLRDSGSQSRALAATTFLANADFYHPIASKMLASDLAAAGDKDTVGNKTKKILMIGAAIAIVAGIGIVLVRRKR